MLFRSNVEISKEILADEWTFQENEFWYQPINGRTIRQGAPAAVSRNASLPKVSAGQTGAKPFVVCSLNQSGAYSVAVLPRTLNGRRAYVGGKVVCTLQRMPEQIALFGCAEGFEISWKEGKVESVTAVGLLGGNEIEIPLSKEGNRFYINADLMKELWKTDDKSAPAVVIDRKSVV